MPFLKYRCKGCNKVFDELVSIEKMDEVKCPECGAKAERAYEGRCAASRSGECAGHCEGCAGCHSK